MKEIACSLCSCVIGDEVAYGDTWDGKPVCEVCAGKTVTGAEPAKRLTPQERALVARTVTGRNFKVIGEDTEVPIILCFEGKGRCEAAVWWPSLNPADIEADKRRLQALACVEWLYDKLYTMGYGQMEEFAEYIGGIGWAIKERNAHKLQRWVLRLIEPTNKSDMPPDEDRDRDGYDEPSRLR